MPLFTTTLTNGADTLAFTGKDLFDIPWTINALAGDDSVTIDGATITSGGGDFTICNLGDGDDFVRVNGGFVVRVYGENGNDRADLYSAAFFDGGFGDDTLNVFGGPHVSMSGGPGADIVNFDAGISASILGGDGDDLFNGNDHVVSGSISGDAGNDTFFNIRAPSGASLTLAGGPGSDLFRGTVSEMNGVTIADFSPGDMLMLTGVDFDLFHFSLSGNTLTYNGGSLSFGAPLNGTLAALPFGAGRVVLKLTGSTINHDAANDFNGDGRSDMLWRHPDGSLVEWLAQANGSFAANGAGSAWVHPDWYVAGTGDFNADGRDDLIWRHPDGSLVEWLAQANGSFANNPSAYTYVHDGWQVAGTGDFNGNGRDDILFRNGTVGWVTASFAQVDGSFLDNDSEVDFVHPGWHVAMTGDFDGDGRDDMIWHHDNGSFVEWLGQADGSFAENSVASAWIHPAWQIQPNQSGAGLWDY